MIIKLFTTGHYEFERTTEEGETEIRGIYTFPQSSSYDEIKKTLESEGWKEIMKDDH